MSEMITNYIKALEDVNALTVRLSRGSQGIWGSGATVKGFLTGEFSVAGNATWGPMFNKSGIEDKVQKVVQSLNTSKTGGMSVSYPIQQRKSWSESSITPFNINFTVLAQDENDDVRKYANILYEGIFPVEYAHTGGYNSKRKFLAPLNYKANWGGRPIGTWTLRVGEYIAIPLLVITNVNVNFSKAKLKSGKPLSAVFSVSLDTTEPVSIDEVKSWFN